MQPSCAREEVVESLERVLSDAKFVAAPQMSAFLKFVVMQTLEGKSDRIKAYTVAVDALGKPATFDPQNDPSVRVLAKRLRDTLTAYYERTSGHNVILLLKSGSYVPKFVKADQISPVLASSNVTTLTERLVSDKTDAPAAEANDGETIVQEEKRASDGNDSVHQLFAAPKKMG